MKSIIYIKASANHGKTEIICKIYEKLKEFDYKDDEKFKTINENSGNKEYKDILRVVVKGDIRIGIASCGDPSENHKKWLDILCSENCDIIICACRTRGRTLQTIEAIKDYDKYGFIPSHNKKSNNKDNISLFYHIIKFFIKS